MPAAPPDRRWQLLTYANSRYRESLACLVASASRHGASVVHAHHPRSLRQFPWSKTHRRLLSATRGAGYFLWKPFLVLEVLLKLPADEFLLYADAGSVLAQPPAPLFEHCASRSGIMLFQVHGFLNSHYVKRDCFKLMGCDEPRFRDAEQVNAAFLVLQHTPRAIAFVAEWVAWSDSLGLISDEPNRLAAPNYPGFVGHRYDQSILSLLAEKHGLPRFPDPSQWGEPRRRTPVGDFAPFPTIFHHHRKRTLFPHERGRMWLGAKRRDWFGPR